jgi:hypothetical protein
MSGMEDLKPVVAPPSKSPRRFRRTRIAVSVFFGVLTAALCVLWVRSYWWVDVVRRGTESVGSSQGRIFVNDVYNLPGKGKVVTRSIAGNRIHFWTARQEDLVAVGVGKVFPQWPAILLAVVSSAAPWLHYRFSLRTLLIATTLVAVVFGLVSFLAR